MTQRSRFLVLLFGDLEFDGRVQRMLGVLRRWGNVALVDVGDEAPPRLGGPGDQLARFRVRRSRGRNKLAGHWKLLTRALVLAHQLRPEVVVAEDFFTTLTGWLAARKSGARLIYDAHELIIPGASSRMSPRDRFWYELERWVVRRADLVVAASAERAEMMQQHYGLLTRPHVMRNIPQATAAGPTRSAVLERFPELARRSTDERVVLYQGAVSLARGIPRFVEAVHHLPPTYRIVIAGDGPDLATLKASAAFTSLGPRASALGRVPNSWIHTVARLADIGIVTYPHVGLNNILCAPNKVFEYAQAGLPIIATDQPPLRRLVQAHGIGLLLPQQADPLQDARAILTLGDNLADYHARIPEFLRAHSWEAEEAQLDQALTSLLDGCRGCST